MTNIKFGTDGWRGIIGFDFNFLNLSKVVVASSQELYSKYYKETKSKKILIGYDRRFMASQFAQSIPPLISGCGLEPILASTCVTTPSCSLYAKENNFLGALVITASHNPPTWLGLKIKDFRGCSVDESFTQSIEKRLLFGNSTYSKQSLFPIVDVKQFHLMKIKSKFNVGFIYEQLKKMRIRVIIDSMHGSAAGYFNKIFDETEMDIFSSIRNNEDPLFGGNPPEPLMKYLKDLNKVHQINTENGYKSIGIVFDGDGDRIAVIDEKGRYCSTQVLLPYFIKHLGSQNNNNLPVLKTVSGSDIIKSIAESQNRRVIELPVGFKYIAENMINAETFIGGEESGGVGFGDFLPERDALYAAMVLLNRIAEESKYLSDSLDEIQKEFGPSFYQRIDISFAELSQKNNLVQFINNNIPRLIGNYEVLSITKIDGLKLRMGENFWVLFRFSGTEPLLRLYCEAPSQEKLEKTLEWCQKFINEFVQ